MEAHFSGGEKRPVEMDSGDTGTILGLPFPGDFGTGGNHSVDFFGRAGGGGGDKGSGATAQMGAVGLANSIGSTVHVVGSVRAMNVDVDESRGDIAIAGINDDVGEAAGTAPGDADNAAIDTFDDAAFEDFFRENDAAGEGDAC